MPIEDPNDTHNAQFIAIIRNLDRIEAKIDALTKSDAVDAVKAGLHAFGAEPTMSGVEAMITDATDILEMRITENGGLPMTLVAPVRKAIEKYRYISKILLDAMNTSRAPQQRAPYEKGGAE